MPEFMVEELTLTEEEKKAFDALPKGDAAALFAGISSEFLSALVAASEKQKCITIVRGANPLSQQDNKEAYHPKPPWIKAKTTNWDFINGFIASRKLIDLLGRKIWDEKTQQYKIITTTLGDIPDESAVKEGELSKPLVYSMPRKIKKNNITNHQILYQDMNAIFLIANDDPHSQGQRLIFKIDLAKRHADDSFNLFCKSEAKADASFEPVEILGMQNQQGELIPVKEDKDICLIAPAKEIIQSAGLQGGVPSASMETYDTFTTGGRISMIEGLIAIDPQIANQLTEMDVVQYGCITPFESGLISLINKIYNSSHPLDADPVQHAGENHNPSDELSSLMAIMLHVILGNDGKLSEIVLTATEKQFAYLALSYAGSYYFEIHPRWKMEYWAAVIEKQLFSGFSINAETMVNYLAYKNKELAPDAKSDEAAYKRFVHKHFNQVIKLNNLTFLPLDRVYVSPIQKMSLWNQTVKSQLDLFKTSLNAKIPMGPQTLLGYYQDEFNVIDKIAKGRDQNIQLLSKNYAIFEKNIIDEILKNEQAIHVFIHPEFDLEKWLPVMIKQLEYAKNNPLYLVNQHSMDAYFNYLQKTLTLTNEELTILQSNPNDLLAKLKHINLDLSVKSENKEKDLYTNTLLTRTSTMRTLQGRGFQLGKEITSPTDPKITPKPESSGKKRRNK